MGDPLLDRDIREALDRRARGFHPTRTVGDVVGRARAREWTRRVGTAAVALGLFAAAATLLIPRLLGNLDDARPATRPSIAAWIPVGGDLYEPMFGEGRLWAYSGRQGLVGIDPTANRIAVRVPDAVPPVVAGGGDLWAPGGGIRYGRTRVLLRIVPETGEVASVVDLPLPADVFEERGPIRTVVALAIHEGRVLAAVGGATVAQIDPETNEVVRTDVLGGRDGEILEMTAAGGMLWTLREGAIERSAGVTHRAFMMSGRVPRTMAVSPDTAWVLLDAGEILRWEDVGARVKTLRPSIDGEITDLAYGEDRLWIVSTRGRGEVVVAALDPSSGELDARISLGAPPPELPEASTRPSIMVAAGSVWVTEPTRGAVVRIDPRGRTSIPVPGPTPSDVRV